MKNKEEMMWEIYKNYFLANWDIRAVVAWRYTVEAVELFEEEMAKLRKGKKRP